MSVDTDGAGRLRELCDARHVDLVLLQEVKPEHRPAFVEALPAYSFFWGDKSQFESYEEQTSALTGIKKELLGDRPDVRVETSITGYRTFAVRAPVGGRPMWLVNVHVRRPAFFMPRDWGRAFAQFAVHRREGEALQEWLAGHADLPTVVAGDFNAPRNSRNLRLSDLTLAYHAAGGGPHLTFPTWLPLVGIDHTLGSPQVEFHAYETFNAGLSDHKAQLSRFAVR
jgi:endonuclease/exonuclease/phosphatase family metal-dependent hydrolase